MKKIPTLFKRIYNLHHRPIAITEEVKEGMEWVLSGEGTATIKWDGSCCAIINGELYKRFDAKKGKKIPDGAIQCCDPDPVTGHWPHWVKCSYANPADKWYMEAYRNAREVWAMPLPEWTYEAVGPHFQNNPHLYAVDTLIIHGKDEIEVSDRSFEGIREYLKNHQIEGIVFWKDDKPQCKIKRSDFGFAWNNSAERKSEPFDEAGVKGYSIGEVVR